MNKDKAGKYRPSLVPMEVVKAIAKVREYGVKKYSDPENWRTVPIEDYVDAFGRHALEVIQNPYSRDRESGLPHLWHCLTNGAFLISLMVFKED